MELKTIPTDLLRVILKYHYQIIHAKVMAELKQVPIPDKCNYCHAPVYYFSARHTRSKGFFCSLCDPLCELCSTCGYIFYSEKGCVVCQNKCDNCGSVDYKYTRYVCNGICFGLRCQDCEEQSLG